MIIGRHRPAIQYELADRVQTANAGGLGVIQPMVKQLGLTEGINRICPIFKMHLPYSEADHVLNIAYLHCVTFTPQNAGGFRMKCWTD